MKTHPILDALMVAIVIAMAIAGCHAISGCSTDRPHNPQPIKFDPHISAALDYPMSQPIDPVTHEVINVCE